MQLRSPSRSLGGEGAVIQVDKTKCMTVHTHVALPCTLLLVGSTMGYTAGYTGFSLDVASSSKPPFVRAWSFFFHERFTANPSSADTQVEVQAKHGHQGATATGAGLAEGLGSGHPREGKENTRDLKATEEVLDSAASSTSTVSASTEVGNG